MAANTKGAKLVDSGDEAGEALRSLHAEQHTRASLLDPSAHSGSLDPLQPGYQVAMCVSFCERRLPVVRLWALVNASVGRGWSMGFVLKPYHPTTRSES